MTLSDIATLASIVSSAAVALSLVYVALQVRQAEKNQRALMQQGRADRAWEGAFRAAADPALSDLFHKGMRTPGDLSTGELDQFLSICRAAFLSGEDSFLQHKSGLLDPIAYASFVAGLKGYMAAPGLRAAWRLTSTQYGDAYAAFMDAILRSTPPSGAASPYAQWQEIVRSEASENQAS